MLFRSLLFVETARDFIQPVATCEKTCVLEVEEIVEPGALDTNAIHIPGVFVLRLVPGEFEKQIEQRPVSANVEYA